MSEDWMAVVLAGGIGSRLFPLTKERPKPMVPICNRPMVDYAIQLLRDAGIKKIVLAVKYKGELIVDWVEKKTAQGYFGDTEVIVPEIDSKDTADAVRKLAQEGLIDRNFVVTMADIVTNLNLRKAIEFHESHDPNPFATICLKPVELPGQFGLTMIDNDNRIHLFLEKPSPPELLMTTMTFSGKGATRSLQHNLANIGIYVLDKRIADMLENHGDLMDWGSHVFPYLLDQNYDVRGYLSDPYWVDAGTHKKYIWANNDVLKKWAYPYLPLEREHRENEFIGEGVEFGENANLVPPVLIGDNCKIGKNTTIGPFVTIDENVEIGDGSQITQSVIMKGSKLGANSRLEYTILSKNVTVNTDERLFKMVYPSNITIDEVDHQYRWK